MENCRAKLKIIYPHKRLHDWALSREWSLWLPKWQCHFQSIFLEQHLEYVVYVSRGFHFCGQLPTSPHVLTPLLLHSHHSDEPVGVGFSYAKAEPGYTNPNYGVNVVGLPSTDCPDYALPYDTCGTYSLPDVTTTPNSTEGAAPRFWKAMQGFLGAFPQYARDEFHFTSESYGGQYVYTPLNKVLSLLYLH